MLSADYQAEQENLETEIKDLQSQINEYKLNTDKSFVLEYMRIIFDNVHDDSEIYDFNWNGKKANCNAIDPSGGPFISVGDTFDGYKIIRIYNKENVGMVIDVETAP